MSPAIAESSDTEAIVDKRPISARVLGGGNAEPGAYPSIVALVSPGNLPLDQRLFCGGTVVADRWVLTAAHCLYDFVYEQPIQPERIRVVAGITDLELEAPALEIGVVRVVIHPDYDNSLELPPNDIALIELETAVSAPAAILFSDESENFISSLGNVAGWGAIDYEDKFNPEYPTALQDAVVPLVSDNVCNAKESYGGSIVRSHLCAGYIDGKVDACAGDSGGPLYININGVQVQIAITSFGVGCGLPLFYGIYTDVSYFIPWLSNFIDVPYQSPEFLAKRAAEGPLVYTGDSIGGIGRKSKGSLAGFSVLVLFALLLLRMSAARVIVTHDISSERILSKLV